MSDCKDEGMNNWRVNGRVSRSPADTYIEWQFEQKCEELANGNDILTEWREKKRQYKSWTETIVFDFQHFSRHDSSHSVNILEAIEMLLGKDRINMLSAGDLWMLLECAYKHDIGMTLTYEELVNLWKKTDFKKYIEDRLYTELQDDREAALFYIQMDNLIRNRDQMEGIETERRQNIAESWEVELERCLMYLAASYIRKCHAKRLGDAEKRLPNPENSVIPDRLYNLAKTASILHGEADYRQILKQLKECTKGFGNGKMHPRFVCAMLRIGDVLDLENNRFNIRSVSHFGDLPRMSKMHLGKHKAITHLKISRSQIEVEALSNKTDVCQVLADDFRMIDEEVQNLICYWNNMAPEEFGGCTLQQSKCRIFYKTVGNLYDVGMHKSIQMDTKKLIDLFMGHNIYNDYMEFIREYLQNALDAVKMQLWLDIKENRYRNKMNPGMKDLKELTPLDLSKDIFENYPINVYVETDWKNQKVEIAIKDCGIGMEKACIDMISKIGQGWKERERYTIELHRMPDWLKPTGGFGIGIQSAFMVSDKVKIYTYPREEVKGYKITIESPDIGGRVMTEELEGHGNGTKVQIKLDLDRFQSWSSKMKAKGNKDVRYKHEYAGRENAGTADLFDTEATLDYILTFLKEFVEEKMNHRLFPVTIINSQRKDIILKSNFLPDVNYWEDSKRYFICRTEEGLDLFDIKNQEFYGWELSRSVLYKVTANPDKEKSIGRAKANSVVSFKNIMVDDERLRSVPLMKHLKLAIDVMGGNVKDMLMMNRDAFREEFNVETWLYTLVYRYFTRLLFWYQKAEDSSMAPLDSDGRKEILENLFAQNPYMALLETVYGSNQWELKPAKEDEIGALAFRVLDEENNQWSESGRGRVSISEVCWEIKKMLDRGKAIVVLAKQRTDGGMFSSIQLKAKVKAEDEKQSLGETVSFYLQNGGYIVDNPDILNMMEMLKCAGKVNMSDFCISQPRENGGIERVYCTCVTYREAAVYIEENMERFYKNSWNGRDDTQRFIYEIKGKGIHELLQVNSLPYEMKMEGKAYIISPIDQRTRVNINSKLSKKKLSWAEFYDIVSKEKSYQLLNRWVADHQASEKKSSEAEIKAEYEKYLKQIYDYNLQEYY